MSSRAYASGEDIFRATKRMLIGILVVGAIAASVWAIVFAITNWQRGIYGGMHLNDARGVAMNAMIVNYGFKFANQVRLADPQAVKKHFHLLSTGTGQVREFHLIGPRNVHYCVDVWDPHDNWAPPDKHGVRIDIGGSYIIKKGCKF
jgi:hypothetical protein